MYLPKNIRYLRKSKGLSQDELADFLGYKSYTTIQKWESGVAEPPIGVLDKVAEKFGITMAEMVTEDLEMKSARKHDNPSERIFNENFYPLSKKRFPVIGTIACGNPIMAEQNIGEYIESTDELNADFCLKCKGDSMIDAGIKEGDVVFIRQQPDVENGEIAAVLIDNEATLKKVNKSAPGFILLEAANPNYEAIVINLNDESTDIRIIGKAIGSQRLWL